jgi:hypothetical protein
MNERFGIRITLIDAEDAENAENTVSKENQSIAKPISPNQQYQPERIALESERLQRQHGLETILMRVGVYNDIIHVIPVPVKDRTEDEFAFVLSFPENMQMEPSEVIKSIEHYFPGFSVVEYVTQEHAKQTA